MYQLLVWDDYSNSEIEGLGTEDSQSPRTIQGKQLDDFLDMCFQRSTFFSLTKATWTKSIDDSVKKELETFLVRELKTSKWFCYDLSEAPEPSQRFLEVYIYHAKPEAKSILLKYFSDIFLNEKEEGVLVQSSQTVEDLCFFSKNLLWLGTVSHEDILRVFLPDEAHESSLNTYGTWRYHEDRKDDVINLELLMNQ